jgi:CMP-N-acetylneuraminic acid synthetase
VSLIAIIPARHLSAGVPCKNRQAWPALRDTLALLQPDATITVTDDPVLAYGARDFGAVIWRVMDERHTVAGAVKAALADQVIMLPEDVVVVLQPSSPTRNRADYVRAAVWQLQTQPELDAVVSVVPMSGEVAKACQVTPAGLLRPFWGGEWASLPDRRQDAPRAYRRDGTVYAVRGELARAGELYGRATAAMLVDPADSVTVD